MKRLDVRLSEGAIADITGIARYIVEETGNLDLGLGFADRIEQRCQKIGHAPQSGTPRPDLGDNLRLIPFERSTIILYRPLESFVEIVNVFYGGRDYAALLTQNLKD